MTGGPGTGKTAVLRERFARLIEGGADPERVALVVGSRRARDEAREALLARFHGSLPELRVVTIHGAGASRLNARFRRLDYAEPPDLLPAGDQFALVQELLSDQDPGTWPAYGHMLGMRAFADEVRQFLSRAQEALLTPEDIEERADEGRAHRVEGARAVPSRVPGRDRRAERRRLRRPAATRGAGAHGRRAAARPPARRRLPGHDVRRRGDLAGLAPADLVVAGDAGRARVLVPGDDRRADPPLRRAVRGRGRHRARRRRIARQAA